MALAADRDTPMKDGELIQVPVATAVHIYAGALVAANATGYATPGATSTTLTYLGRAEENVNNTGADGAKTVKVRRRKAFKWLNSGADAVTQASWARPATSSTTRPWPPPTAPTRAPPPASWSAWIATASGFTKQTRPRSTS